MSRDLADQFDRDLEAPPDVKARARAIRQRTTDTPTPTNLEARLAAARTDEFVPVAVESWTALWAHWRGDRTGDQS